MIGTIINLEGKRFNMLLVLSMAESEKGRDSRWLCRCDCGTEKIISAPHLKTGSTKSCGCYSKTHSSQLRHGHTKNNKTSTEWRSWKSMRDRCLDKNHDNYFRYGGKGISVCERWVYSFDNFLKDMGIKPSPSYTIDRVDNNGNYEPSNCRWASRKTQARNRSSARLITHNDETKTITEWSEDTGIPRSVLYHRFGKLGWSVEKALTTPKEPRNFSSSKHK